MAVAAHTLAEGILLVHVLTFRDEAPYFNDIAPHRF